MGRFPSESSCLRLVFATLLAASKTWRRVRMTPEITKQVLELRNQLYSEGKDSSVAMQRREGKHNTDCTKIAS